MSSEEFKKRKKEYQKNVESSRSTEMKFTTVGGEPVNVLYSPDDIEDINYLSEIGFPGEYPYT
ncbi:MAG: methylmalonyl-CoA mutase, partial [Ignavibacteriaceae bacterium]